jgi:hypothetical protein
LEPFSESYAVYDALIEDNSGCSLPFRSSF